MISKLQLKNFKCWQDTGPIDMAPLTVLFGCNSSGKSSIGQFLMLLKQSAASADRGTVFLPGTDATPVDVGQPSDMLFGGDLDRTLGFEYRWTIGEVLDFEDASKAKGGKYSFDEIDFRGDYRLGEPKKQIFEVHDFQYELFHGGRHILKVGLEKKRGSQASKRPSYKLSESEYKFTHTQGRPQDINSPIRFYGFPDEAVAYYQNASFLQLLNFRHESMLSSVFYLGPLRTKAKRLYTRVGWVPPSVGDYGGDAIEAILSARDEGRRINLKYRSPMIGFEGLIAKCLKKMELIEDFQVEQIPGRQDYEVKVMTQGSGHWVNIPDVGVGVSQVLPVIVEMFYAPPGSTIIMEQPELHLHPRAQAGLADVMIDAIRARQDEKDRNIQLIIETHSEHFLLRLQRRIAEDALKEDELRAYFLYMKNGEASLERLNINLYGDAVNWPKGFFGDKDGDIIFRTKAGLVKRRMQLQRAGS
jgi:hypothetical protein